MIDKRRRIRLAGSDDFRTLQRWAYRQTDGTRAEVVAFLAHLAAVDLDRVAALDRDMAAFGGDMRAWIRKHAAEPRPVDLDALPQTNNDDPTEQT